MGVAGGPVDPVFLDRTGRRRRLFVAAGSAGGLLLLVAVVALIAGFTAAGPGSVPGFPGGDELRIGRPEPAVSVRPRTPATRTPDTRTTTTRTPVPRATEKTAAAPGTADPTGTPTSPAATTAPTNPHRRVPTHTPKPHKSKKF
jgi:hypothetical protein